MQKKKILFPFIDNLKPFFSALINVVLFHIFLYLNLARKIPQTVFMKKMGLFDAYLAAEIKELARAATE